MPKWIPHKGPQEKALERTEFEVLFGGSRGPGKTDAGIVKSTDNISHPRFRGLVIRKNADDLSDWIDRAGRMYASLGGKAAGKPTVFKFPSGAVIRTGHLKDENAYTKYQGHEYQFMLIEELTQIPDESRYLKLISSCRSSFADIKPQVFCTTNPGGVGHAWVKERFVDPTEFTHYTYINEDGIVHTARMGRPFKDKDSGRYRIFIPATLDDNPTLMKNDPGYALFMDSLKSKDIDLWKAWRLGDWDTFAGQYFKEFNVNTHVIRPFMPKDTLWHIGGLDWGRNDPFSLHTAIVAPIVWTSPENGMTYKFYRVITYNEVYGGDRSPKEQSIRCKEARVNLNIIRRISADNQIFNKGNDNSISIYDQFVEEDNRWGPLLQAGSKDRIPGWENMHNWLSIAPDGLPYWLITSNCTNLIKELPLAVHDENIKEDLIAASDHAIDEQRYMLKDLKWVDAKVGIVNPDNNRPKFKPQIRTAVMDLDLDAFTKS